MKFYIGLGGIGCRTLEDYQKHSGNDEEKFFFIDSDHTVLETEQAKNKRYIVPMIQYGTMGQRSIGRNSVNYEIFNGKMNEFFSAIKSAEKVDLVFSVSSFGGFGSSALFPLLEYLEAISWEVLRSCTVFAFNEKSAFFQCFPKNLRDLYELNTYQFASDISVLNQMTLSDSFISVFNPKCTCYLLDTSYMSPDVFWKCFEYSEEQLNGLNCLSEYRIAVNTKASGSAESVFISYSSKDQVIADEIFNHLQKVGITPWIATRSIKEGSYAKQIVQGISRANIFVVIISEHSISSEHVKNEIDIAFNRIKDGMVIVPFVVDNAELDEECRYYLSRQEIFFGRKPPIHDRIRELTEHIQAIENQLNNRC